MDTQVAYILSLGVVKEFRKHGIGKTLLRDSSVAVLLATPDYWTKELHRATPVPFWDKLLCDLSRQSRRWCSHIPLVLVVQVHWEVFVGVTAQCTNGSAECSPSRSQGIAEHTKKLHSCCCLHQESEKSCQGWEVLVLCHSSWSRTWSLSGRDKRGACTPCLLLFFHGCQKPGTWGRKVAALKLAT